jgi:hypothetical protein
MQGLLHQRELLAMACVTISNMGRSRALLLPPGGSRICTDAGTDARRAIAVLLTVTHKSVNVFGASACFAIIALPHLRENSCLLG